MQLLPLETDRRLFKKVSQCFENIWHSIHGDKDAETEMKVVMPKILEESGLREEMQNQRSSSGNNEKEIKEGA